MVAFLAGRRPQLTFSHCSEDCCRTTAFFQEGLSGVRSDMAALQEHILRPWRSCNIHAAMDNSLCRPLLQKLTYSQLCLGFAPLPRRKKVGGACTCQHVYSRPLNMRRWLRHPKFSNEGNLASAYACKHGEWLPSLSSCRP